MSKRLFLSLGILVSMGSLIWLATKSKPTGANASRSHEHSAPADSATHVSAREPKSNSMPSAIQADAGDTTSEGAAEKPVTVGDGLAEPSITASERPSSAGHSGPELGPGLTPTAVMGNMRLVFRQFCSQFGANPVGTNPEITSALNGGNPKQVVLVDREDGLRINERGELIDNWGTPFFFHQVSAKEMEIRSAGPDRRLWTTDDLVLK
jgi:hypothetical protein